MVLGLVAMYTNKRQMSKMTIFSFEIKQNKKIKIVQKDFFIFKIIFFGSKFIFGIFNFLTVLDSSVTDESFGDEKGN